jgi:uncharacterized protein YdaU (DUF1376 family)
MQKPNYFYFRAVNYLTDVRGMSMAARGAYVTLVAEMFQRWQPDSESLPFLPDDAVLLQRLCGGAKNWHRVNDDVLQKLTRQDGKLFSPWLNSEILRLSEHWKADGAKKAEKKAKKEKPAHPNSGNPDAAELEAATINGQPAPTARSWDEAPAPDGDMLVYGLQGFRAVGWSEMAALLRHPAKLKEADCTLWKVSGTKSQQAPVKVLKIGKSFACRLASGQTVHADS